MDNERLNTILKVIAGLGSAGVAATSQAAGRAVLGAANTWSNVEENERRKKEAEELLSQRNRDMALRESEHEQGKRLSDLKISQAQSEIEANENARKFLAGVRPGLEGSVERLRQYTTEESGGALPAEEAALAAAAGGDLPGYIGTKEKQAENIYNTQAERSRGERQFKIQNILDERAARRDEAILTRQAAAQAAAEKGRWERESNKQSTRNEYSQKDLNEMRSIVKFVELGAERLKIPVEEYLDLESAKRGSQDPTKDIRVIYETAKNVLGKIEGEDTKVLPPDKVVDFLTRNKQ